ncbi:MarR family winged helix-turn-helix transcriptional regulator [Haliovirga abyssi]|uniref:MarR family transcriptional regulator n=1 Tax=Haliovirga abyssi TaxID=2996794 RepID=A0AAU9DAB4_9FUSO|nr:MarR family transcriptional regulator [Haliovirga abyssi]BDU50541.1 MarR family transcriptional regulator [Haliovirga abyssi]
MKTKIVNELLEEFYKVFYEIEELSLKQGIKTLTTTELHIIEAIGTNSLTMNQLSDKLGITMGTATVAINKLLKKEFINRNRCEHDRRKVYVSLTKTGIDALKYHQNFHKIIISNITKELSSEELENFINSFNKILGNLKKQFENIKPDSIDNFDINSDLIISDVKGSSALKTFFKEKNISAGNNLKILNKTDKSIELLINNDNKMTLDILDSKNIFAINNQFKKI